jgi:hypothetical protein
MIRLIRNIKTSNISDEVTGFKQDFATRFNARAALKSMPHTL